MESVDGAGESSRHSSTRMRWQSGHSKVPFSSRLEFAPAQTGEFVYGVEVHYFLLTLKCAPRGSLRPCQCCCQAHLSDRCAAVRESNPPRSLAMKTGSHRRHLRLRLQQRGGENFEETSKKGLAWAASGLARYRSVLTPLWLPIQLPVIFACIAA